MTAISNTPIFFLAHAGAELYGADRVFLESVRALVSTGSTVVVTLPSNGPLVEMLAESGATVFICSSPVLRKSLLRPIGMMRLAGSGLAGTIRGYRLLRKIRPNVIYVNTVTVPVWPILGKLMRIPVLVHVHEAERTASKWLRTALVLPLLCAKTIVCNSRYSAGSLSEVMPRLRRRTTVVNNGLPGPDLLIPARDVASAPFRVLYIGRLSERKGVHTAIQAIANLRDTGLDTVLDVVGAIFPGNEEYLSALQRQVEVSGLEDAVKFHGFDPDVWKWFSSCDVTVVPSAGDEPFGDTAVEAVLAARPVIASRTPGLTEAAGDYSCVQLVESGNAEAFASALKDVSVRWNFYADSALADASVAATKHSPALYGARIHDELAKLLPATH